MSEFVAEFVKRASVEPEPVDSYDCEPVERAAAAFPSMSDDEMRRLERVVYYLRDAVKEEAKSRGMGGGGMFLWGRPLEKEVTHG